MDGLTPQAIVIIAAIAIASWGIGEVGKGVKAVGHHVKGAIVHLRHPHTKPEP